MTVPAARARLGSTALTPFVYRIRRTTDPS